MDNKLNKRGGSKENAESFKRWAIEHLTIPDELVFCENATMPTPLQVQYRTLQ